MYIFFHIKLKKKFIVGGTKRDNFYQKIIIIYSSLTLNSPSHPLQDKDLRYEQLFQVFGPSIVLESGDVPSPIPHEITYSVHHLCYFGLFTNFIIIWIYFHTNHGRCSEEIRSRIKTVVYIRQSFIKYGVPGTARQM